MFLTDTSKHVALGKAFLTDAGKHIELSEAFVTDGGIFKLLWSAFSKVKAGFNGYSYKYAYTNPGGSGTVGDTYNADISKNVGPNFNYVIAISKDGYYYLTTYPSPYTIYYVEGSTSTKLMEGITLASADYIKSTSVYSVSDTLASKFNSDSSRLCYICRYRTASGVKYSLALVFWKLDSSTGQFVYEKDICLCEKDLYSSSSLVDFHISDDFTTILCSYRNSAGTYTQALYKGSPDNGYTSIYSNTTAAEYVEGEVQLDEECGEYCTMHGGIYYISGNAATHVATATSQVIGLSFSYDRSMMYAECGGFDDGIILECYSINGATITLMGNYVPDYFSIYDENSKGEALVLYGTKSTTQTLAHATLSKNSDGVITGKSVIKKMGNDGYLTSANRALTRFYSTEV